jgi:hypothetical protein
MGLAHTLFLADPKDAKLEKFDIFEPAIAMEEAPVMENGTAGMHLHLNAIVERERERERETQTERDCFCHNREKYSQRVSTIGANAAAVTCRLTLPGVPGTDMR